MLVSRLLACVGCATLLLLEPLGAQPIRPDIRINNETGVNGEASGAPGAMPAVFKAGCFHTNGSSSTTLTCVDHGMSLFPTDGSAAIWLNTSSGRRWSRVTGFPDADHVTVADSFNISSGAAVDGAIGGKIAGVLSNVPRLCTDVGPGWTITLEHTGTDYTDSGSTCGLGSSTGGDSLANQGRLVVRGDDPDNPTRILFQSNTTYLNNTGTTTARKTENLHIIRDVAGTSGNGVAVGTPGGLLKNVIVEDQTGTWGVPFLMPSVAAVVLNSHFIGPFSSAGCFSADDADVYVGNFFDGCGGGSSAQDVAVSAGALFAFNVIDSQSTNTKALVLGGGDGLVLFNTIKDAGQQGLALASATSVTIAAGNLVTGAASLSASCFSAETNTGPLLGVSGGGEPHQLWRGNNAFNCSNGLYGSVLPNTTEGQARDIDAGAGLNPQYVDEGDLDLYPLSRAMKSALIYPGLGFPFLTPALPVSVGTAGASQRPGGGSSAYAF